MVRMHSLIIDLAGGGGWGGGVAGVGVGGGTA